MLGIQEAEHAEFNPDASTLVISKLRCALVGETQSVIIMPATLTFQAYGFDGEGVCGGKVSSQG